MNETSPSPIPLQAVKHAKRLFAIAALTIVSLASFSHEVFANENNGRKILLSTNKGEAHATLMDNETARTFASRLPMTLDMSVHFGRELYGTMAPLPVADPLTKTYKVGDIGYWPPAPGFAIYFEVAGPAISGDGVAILGSLDNNVEIFRNGATQVTISLEE